MWHQIVNNHAGFTPDEVQYSAVDEVMKLARRLQKDGFDDMTSEDVNGLIESQLKSLIDKDLVEMTKSANAEEDDKNLQEKKNRRAWLSS